jgi:VWFA-related protein
MQIFRTTPGGAILSCTVLLVISSLFAQTTPSPAVTGQAPSPTMASVTTEPAVSIRINTRVVVVDLVATNKNGATVTDLTQDDLTLLEDGKPEKITFFSSSPDELQKIADIKLEPLPPDIYSNNPKYRQPSGPLVLMLLDGLNTGTVDQAYFRQQMLHYLRTQLKADQRVAVFALAEDLLLLQDFTSDSRLLIDALEKSSAKKSMVLSRGDPVTVTPAAASIMSRKALAALDRLNQEGAVDSIDTRVSLTLAALRSIARAMAGYPGRKNLIWVSDAFPLSLSPADTGYLELSRSYAAEIQETARFLSSAQVAVYTVDARGLVGGTEPQPSGLVSTVAGPEQPTGEDEMTKTAVQVDTSHAAMEHLARATGGRAFYNGNDLSKAVASGISDGASYYTLGYYPQSKTWDGKFRRIEIKTRRKGITIRCREGYYAFDSAEARARPNTKQQDRMQELLAAALDPMPATGVTFRAHLAPAPADHSSQEVQFRVDADSISFEDAGQGRQRCSLDFAAFSVSADGKIVDSTAKTVDAQLPADQYASVLQEGLPFRMEIKTSLGNQHLRLAVRDNRTGTVGTLEIPLPVGNSK